MRARWLKPEFFTDKKIAALGPVVAIVYEALWCMADDGGTAQCDADTVKAQMFYRWSAVGVPEITEALRLLSMAGRIECYQVGDDWFARIPTWEDHQQVHKPSKFRYPAMPEGVTPSVPGECGTGAAPLPAPPPPRHLDTKNPRHLDTHPSPRKAARRDENADGFAQLWSDYPKRAGSNPRQRAFRAYTARRMAGVEHDVMAAGVARYTAFLRATGKEGSEFVMQAATFFGPDEHWSNPWRAPGGQAPSLRFAPSVTEEADRLHTNRVALEERYDRAAHRAGSQWAKEHPAEFAPIKALVDATFRGISGDFAAAAIKADLTQRCAKAAGFPSFDEWLDQPSQAGAA